MEVPRCFHGVSARTALCGCAVHVVPQVDVVQDSFHGYFCRRCRIFNCRTHGEQASVHHSPTRVEPRASCRRAQEARMPVARRPHLAASAGRQAGRHMQPSTACASGLARQA